MSVQRTLKYQIEFEHMQQQPPTAAPSYSSSSSLLYRHNFTPKRWMTQLACASPTLFPSAAIVHVPMVGAHDAGTFGVHPSSQLAADLPESLARVPNFLQTTLRRIVAGWSKTQRFGFLAQLEHGVRYFDVRLSPQGRCAMKGSVAPVTAVASSSNNDSIWISHGSLSVPFDAAVEEILMFYQQQEGADENLETVVLDLQRISGFLPHHWILLEDALERLRPLIISATQYEMTSPLGSIWSSSSSTSSAQKMPRIFILAPPEAIEKLSLLHRPRCMSAVVNSNDKQEDSDKSTVIMSSLLFARNPLNIRSHWHQQRLEEPLLEDLAKELRTRAVGSRFSERHQLHVLQAVLTPTAKDITIALLHPTPRCSTVLELALQSNGKILDLWESLSFRGDNDHDEDFFVFRGAEKNRNNSSAIVGSDPRNILMIDFIELGRSSRTARDAVQLCFDIARRRFAVPTDFVFDVAPVVAVADNSSSNNVDCAAGPVLSCRTSSSSGEDAEEKQQRMETLQSLLDEEERIERQFSEERLRENENEKAAAAAAAANSSALPPPPSPSRHIRGASALDEEVFKVVEALSHQQQPQQRQQRTHEKEE